MLKKYNKLVVCERAHMSYAFQSPSQSVERFALRQQHQKTVQGVHYRTVLLRLQKFNAQILKKKVNILKGDYV